MRDLRGEHAYEEQDCLWVNKTSGDLAFVEMLVLDASLVASYTLYCKEALAVVKKMRVGRRVSHQKPYDDGPQASRPA